MVVWCGLSIGCCARESNAAGKVTLTDPPLSTDESVPLQQAAALDQGRFCCMLPEHLQLKR